MIYTTGGYEEVLIGTIDDIIQYLTDQTGENVFYDAGQIIVRHAYEADDEHFQSEENLYTIELIEHVDLSKLNKG